MQFISQYLTRSPTNLRLGAYVSIHKRYTVQHSEHGFFLVAQLQSLKKQQVYNFYLTKLKKGLK